MYALKLACEVCVSVSAAIAAAAAVAHLQEGYDEEEEADIEASIFEQYLSICDEGSVDPDT